MMRIPIPSKAQQVRAPASAAKTPNPRARPSDADGDADDVGGAAIVANASTRPPHRRRPTSSRSLSVQ
jgi:hypothetical protein